MVGALMYLTASRPDIVHATCYCARYQARPTEKHLNEVKRIFRYLKNTINMGLWYLKDTSFKLTAFSDSYHAGCLDTRKSTSGGIQFLGGDKLVRWSSKLQCLQQKPIQHSRTKHIDVRYHFIKEHVEKRIVELFFDGTEYQLAGLFTKALPEDRLTKMIAGIEDRHHEPSDAMHNPSQPFEFLSKETCLICHEDAHNIFRVSFGESIVEQKGIGRANWPDGNWPDGNWEELPIEFCEDGVDGFEDDD
ncbi:hypothetical protein Tco_1235091 [Tanacetum coccineum]